jgi:hypothetical protein
MYLKKVDGPRAVTLPDGTVMTRADLPDPGVRALGGEPQGGRGEGGAARADGAERGARALRDLGGGARRWMAAVDRHGEVALKATAVQRYRQP